MLPEAYNQNMKLQEAFIVSGIAYDRNGLPNVNSVEHRDYPIFAVQFHPEKTSTIWTPSIAAPHTRQARDLCQYFANFIVDEARKSDHSYPWEQLKDRLFVNFEYKMTDGGAQDIYLF